MDAPGKGLLKVVRHFIHHLWRYSNNTVNSRIGWRCSIISLDRRAYRNIGGRNGSLVDCQRS